MRVQDLVETARAAPNPARRGEIAHRANRLADALVRQGIHADRIHGNRSQGQRTQALAAFKSGRCPVLVATDIAARGIDVDALGHVVNFDVPQVPDDYIHRVGRTGRAEATGDAFTFMAPEERGELAAIERARSRAKQHGHGGSGHHRPAQPSGGGPPRPAPPGEGAQAPGSGHRWSFRPRRRRR